MRRVLFVSLYACFISSMAWADTFGTGANQFTIDFVNISADSNPSSGYGIVNNDYRIGTYEVTNDQWNKFEAELGVSVTGNPSEAYDWNSAWKDIDVPANRISWYEAAQFVNYLNTSTGHQAAYKFTGTQGTGNYTLGVWEAGNIGYDADNPYRNSNAHYFMPTEDGYC
ncbi:MAG: SUMF1/EgtB/PvdO family nonheme iron enzyme [Phycisphaerae bacterium]|nr:SUMF1/EgtB/PvdO family nonheme iron enzyme [Phycisphaerae bacterium]